MSDKFGWLELLEMIEEHTDNQQLQEKKSKPKIKRGSPLADKKFNASKFISTALQSYQAPTEKAGELGTQERKNFEFFISNRIRGKNIEEKINSINKFVTSSELGAETKISTILSHCGTLVVLQKIIEDYNPSAAGFAFEAFLAALLKGKQIVDTEGGSLPIEDVTLGGAPVSLKLLSPGKEVEGSIENLLDFFARDEIQEKSIEYIVTIKHGDKSLGFYSFNITPENFFNWVKPKYFNWSKVPSGRFGRKKLTREERELLNEAVLDFGEVEERAKLFKNIARQFFRFWGYEDSKNPDSLNYRTYIPTPSARSSQKKAEFIEFALPHEADLQRSKVYQYRDDLFFTPEQIKIFKRGVKGKKFGNRQYEVNLDNMFKILTARKSHFNSKIQDWGPSHNLSIYWLNVYRRMIEEPSDAPAEGVVGQKKYLASLLRKKNYKRWNEILKAAMVENQFVINQNDVVSGRRADTNLYGVLTVDRKVVEKILKQYSQQLGELCAPIYQLLGELTDNINRFYLLNSASAAYKASEQATELDTYTDRLTEQV